MYQNKKNELIYFDERFCSNEFFHVSMAGRTLPNPGYVVDHSPKSTIWTSYNFEYVVSGKGYIETKDKTFTVRQGDLFFLNKQQTHFYYADKTSPFEKIFIVCEGVFVDNLVKMYSFTESVRIVHTDAHGIFDAIFALLGKLDAQQMDGDTNIDIAALVLKLAHKIAPPEFYTNTVAIEKTAASVMKEYIDINIYRRLTVKELSEVMHLSVSQVERIFKIEYGVTPHRYIIEKKLTEAAELFSTTDMNIAEVAEKLAFSNIKNFSKQFKLRFEMTPSKFIQRQRAQKTAEVSGRDSSAVQNDPPERETFGGG